jgi:hypothetical protein
MDPQKKERERERQPPHVSILYRPRLPFRGTRRSIHHHQTWRWQRAVGVETASPGRGAGRVAFIIGDPSPGKISWRGRGRANRRRARTRPARRFRSPSLSVLLLLSLALGARGHGRTCLRAHSAALRGRSRATRWLVRRTVHPRARVACAIGFAAAGSVGDESRRRPSPSRRVTDARALCL